MTRPALNQVAASRLTPTDHRDPSLPPVEACRQANLPVWAQSVEARVLLSLVMLERPERTKPIATDLTGNTAAFGYRGKTAARLRQLFETARDGMLQALPHGEEARDGFIAWCKANSSDALIERLIEARS